MMNPMIQRFAISLQIGAFSSRNVTYEVDALNAFQGFFQRMQRLKKPIRQFCGMPIQKSCAFPVDGHHSEPSQVGDEEKPDLYYEPGHLGGNGVLTSALYWPHEPVSTMKMRAIKRRPVFPSRAWLGWIGKVSWSLDPPFDETSDIGTMLTGSYGTWN
jgi:hypothetical protein